MTSLPVEAELGKLLWLGGDRKGGYTRPDHDPRAMIRALGEEAEDHDDARLLGAPQRTIEFVFDFVEICGGSGVVSEKAAALGLSVCIPLDLSRSPILIFGLTNLDLLWWILGMIQTGRFRSVCCEPPCTTFSPAQHPASRSYAQPHFGVSLPGDLLDSFSMNKADWI